MEGTITVSYTVICDNDINLEITLQDLLANEKIQAAIKKEFAPGARGIGLDAGRASGQITLAKEKKIYQLEIDKNDYADALTLAEEDAQKKKLLKSGCSMVELLDLTTH